MAKAKGTALINAVKALRALREEARRVLPEHLHWYLNQRILLSSWYPEEDFVQLLRALARLIPDTGMDPYEYMGRFVARVDLAGVYAHLIRKGDPVTTLRRTSVIWGLYHDTGKEEVVDAGENHIVTQISGFEHPSRESCGTVRGWNAELAVMAGAKNVKIVHSECVLDGASACRFEMSWSS